MSHKVLIFLAVLVVATMESCSGPDLFRGSYSYRTSGKVYFHNLAVKNESETGQLTITKTGRDSVMLLVRPLVNDVYYLRGSAKGDSLFLNDIHTEKSVTVGEKTYNVSYVVSGKGRLSDGTLLLKRKCEGIIYDNTYMPIGIISSDEIITIATPNKE